MFDLSSAARLAAETGRRLDTAGVGFPTTTTVADPYAAAGLGLLDPEAVRPRIERGVVVDFVAGGHAYRVSMGQRSFVWASLGSGGTFAAFGVRPAQTLPPGARVWLITSPLSPGRGTIVAVEPHPSFHRGYHPAEGWWPFFRSGHSADAAHRAAVDESAVVGQVIDAVTGSPAAPWVEVPDLSAGRPLDSTSAGEAGWFAETGVAVAADPFHAFLRADEATGVFAFYHDRMLRTTGYNRQDWSSLDECERLDDAGELHGVRRGWVYPWEGVGLWRWNQVTPGILDSQPGQGSVGNDPASVQSGTGYAVAEPESPTQVAAARWYEYSGYLGQAGNRIVAAPMQFLVWQPVAAAAMEAGARASPGGAVEYYDAGEAEWVTPSENEVVQPADRALPEGDAVSRGQDDEEDEDTYGDFTPRDLYSQPGVFQQFQSLTGRWMVRTAKGAAIVRRPAVPTPRQRLRPEDPAGDGGVGNYRPSGLTPGAATAAASAAHAVRGQIRPTFGGAQRVAAVFDALAYGFNWESLHPFAYHQKDWHTPEEADAYGSDEDGNPARLVNQVVPDYSTLACRQHLDDPDPVYLEVDHRYGLAAYYPTESGLVLHDEGAVSLYDGWGSSVDMHNGDVRVSSAGDIVLAPGRNLVIQAGHDVIIRAKDSIDGSTSTHDIRWQANRNLHGVAGVSGCGGVVLESQAVCPGYGFEGNVGEEVDSSGVVLLAKASQVYAYAQDVVMRGTQRVLADAGEDGRVRVEAKLVETLVHPDGVRTESFLSAPGVVAAANEFTRDRSVFDRPLYLNSPLFAYTSLHAGTVVTQGAYQNQRHRGIPSRIDYLTDTFSAGVDAALSVPPGAEFAEYTARNDQQYLTESGWRVWAARWQVLAYVDAQDLPVWAEPPVVATVSGEVGYPYPGTRWGASGSYAIQVPKYADGDDGWVSVNRRATPGAAVSTVYTNPSLFAPLLTSAEDGYTVSVSSDIEQECE